MPYLGGLIIVLWIFCLIDVATADEHGVRNIPPKLAWLVVVVLLPLVGSVMWLLAGRPVGGGIWGGGSGTRPPHTSGDSPSTSPNRADTSPRIPRPTPNSSANAVPARKNNAE